MDNFGGITPNPNEGPRLDSMPPAVPGQPQPAQAPTFIDPNGPNMQQPQNFASVPMTDPNEAVPMSAQPSMPPLSQIDSMLEQPAPVASPSGLSKGKLVAIIAVGLVIFAAAFGGGYALGYMSGKSAGKTASDAEYQAQQAKLQAEQDAKDESDTPEELDLGEQVEPDYSVDEDIEGAIGDTLAAADGFVIRVNNIERNFTTKDPDFKADAAKELIKVNFQMGNATKSKTMDINNTPFKLVDSTGSEIVPVTIAEYEGKFDVTKLDPGSQSNASIIFSVTKDDKPLKFVRKQPYRISNENREVTFKTTIEIAK
jgi:hypothetical protein